MLVVDDEPEVADVYALRLSDDFETEVAYSGREALEKIDVGLDVVLLDRRMPDLSGADVLDAIREGGYDCRVVMLTAVDPGLDVVEMPFDEYLCKPVEQSNLVEVIEGQLEARRHDEPTSAYLEARTKLALLEQRLSPDELESSDEIDRLETRIEELEPELDTPPDELDIQPAVRDASEG